MLESSDRQYLRKQGPERVILFGSKSFHVYVCFAEARYCDAMFLVKKKKCASHTYFSAVSPPSEFYNISIDGSNVKCLICTNIVGHFDLKSDSIILNIEKIRLVRIEPRNLTAVCTTKETNHSHEMLVSSAYCDTVYKSYTNPEFHNISRYKTLKHPCPLLPDQILGFNFISSISRSFRYLKVHRFRHPSSLCGITNPLSTTTLHNSIFSSFATDTSTALSDTSSISIDSTPSQAPQTVSANLKSDSDQPITKPTNSAASYSAYGLATANHHFQQNFYAAYPSCEPSEPTTAAGRSTRASYTIASQEYNVCPSRPEHAILAPISQISHNHINSDTPMSSEPNFIQLTNVSSNSITTTSAARHQFNRYEMPSDFDMVHFE